MSARTKARKRAVEALFAADVRSSDSLEQLALARKLSADRQNQEDIFEYAREIVEGVRQHADEIDTFLEAYSQGWSVDRMPFVDRAIMRVACWEILKNDAVADEIAISEAVKLAKEYSTEESPSFINGLLSKISATKRAL